MDDPVTRQRELNALFEAMEERGKREATVVTLHHEEHLKNESGHIHIVPAWMWALSSFTSSNGSFPARPLTSVKIGDAMDYVVRKSVERC
jgi:hypothetical protein